MEITCDVCKEKYESGLINYSNHKCSSKPIKYDSFQDLFGKNMKGKPKTINITIGSEILELFKNMINNYKINKK